MAAVCFLATAAVVWRSPQALGSVYEVVGRVRSSFAEQKDIAKARVKHPAVLAAILQELRQPYSPEQLLSRLRVEVGGGNVRIRYRTTDPVHGRPVVEALCREVELAYRVSLSEQRDELQIVRRDLLHSSLLAASNEPASAAGSAVPAVASPPAARPRRFWFMRRPSPQPAPAAAAAELPPTPVSRGRAVVSEAVRQEVTAIDQHIAGRYVEVLGVEVHPASPWPGPWRRVAMTCLLGALGSYSGLAVLARAARRS